MVLLLVFGIYLVSNLISAAYLYSRMNVAMGPHFGAIYILIARAREELLLTVVITNLVAFLMTAAGVSILGILFTHKIAGPMYRVKMFASSLGNGKFGKSVSFRRNDALKNLAVSLGAVAQAFNRRSERVESDLRDLEDTLLRLKNGENGLDDTEELINRLKKTDASIRESLIETG